MERYIKTLYIVSITAIVAFLCLQSYWLFSRYEYSVKEYENKMLPQISEVVDEYNIMRGVKPGKQGGGYRYVSNYNMDKITDDKGNTVRTIKVKARKYEPWRLLGYPSSQRLSEDEILKASQLALLEGAHVDSFTIIAEVDMSHPESVIWGAADAVSLDFNHPFSALTLDSLLRKNQIFSDISLIRTDSMLWKPTIKRSGLILNPQVSYTLPYSILENKCVVVSLEVPVRDIFGGMLWTLILAAVVSVLLIFCLICQFKIIFRLNRLDKMRNSFITTMIHELKRPVSTLKMCVSGLRNKKMVEDTEVREELLGNTKEALNLLSAYFSKMRDITFNDRNQIPLSCTKIGLHQLVDNTAKRVSASSGKVVEYENVVDAATELYADSSHLSNIFLNLFENALKYSGDSVTIRIDSQKKEDGSIAITIKDNGNGIAQSDLGKVFSRFYRGKASESDIPGMGLGLAYVRLLVEAHGGSISVESHTDGPDKGTCFTINLPQ